MADNDDIFVDTKPAKKLSKTKVKTEEQKERIAEILAAGRAKRAEKLAKAKSEKMSSSMTETEIRKLIEKINNESRGTPSPREEPVKVEPVKPVLPEPVKQEPVKPVLPEPIVDTHAEIRRKNAAKMRLLYGNRFNP